MFGDKAWDQRVKEQPRTVIVIGDGAGIRESRGSLLRSVGFSRQLFGSVGEFLRRPERPACLVLEVRQPQSASSFSAKLPIAVKGGAAVTCVMTT
jgi:FixJ family two-component response regulator